ncbi:M23 family metallopeptidase [Paracoccaceae bacterium Fryx2]|nr:M23 family metallopeptidase [Paracoccaceae bacterium Fryx2]
MIRSLIALLLASAPAGAFDLGLPLDCTLGETCFIQQYVDRDPGPQATDFTCGPLSYDGHEGTDFALPSLAAMQTGVTVRAAAAGVVKGGRDGMPDIAANDPAAPPLEGRDCGNGLVIDHADGWQTQYCHLKNGSVTRKAGDAVEKGAALGQVGLSGRTEFPHVHITLRHNGRTIDPFDPDEALTCGEAAPALWSDPLPYRPGGLVNAGFSSTVPAFEAIKAGLSEAPLPADAPALVLWVHVFGGRAGDDVSLRITGPEGEVITQTGKLEKTQARLFRAAGKKLRAARWPAGPYLGEAILIRDGLEIDRLTTTLTIGD